LSRIARALTAFLLLIIVAGVAGAGTLGVLYAREDIRRHQSDAVVDRAATIASIVGDALGNDVNAVRGTSAHPGFHTAVVLRRYGDTSPYLLELASSDPRFAAIAVYDAFGRLAVRLPFDRSIAGRRFGRQEYFSKAKPQGVPHISRLFVQLGQPKVPVIAFSIRIARRSSVHGVLVATVPISQYDALIAPYIPEGWTGRIYDSGGDLVSPAKEASGRSFTNDPIVGPALQGRLVNRRVGGSLIAAAPVQSYGWAVVVSQPRATINAHLRDETVRLSWYAGAATFLAIAGVILASVRRRPPQT
jgi:hypothetical protein